MSVDTSNLDGALKAESVVYGEMWAYVQRLSRAIQQGMTRVGLAVMSSGLALAGANLMANPQHTGYGAAALAASALFGVWFAGSVLTQQQRRA